jgi:myo-inositol catabolism protein IolC
VLFTGHNVLMADELFLLAMDHRDSLEHDVYGITGDPDAADVARLQQGKLLIFQGLLAAIEGGADAAAAGVLVDERFGAEVARRARQHHVDLAMPIERSGQKLFTLEYGDDWLEHVADFDPDQVKVLVRDNPDDDPAGRAKQFKDLAVVSWALKEAARSFIVELLVPATAAQLAQVGADALRYDRELRPALTTAVIADFQSHGVEPTLWKIEGLETADAAAQVVAAARQGGRDEVRCIVLGRDAPADRLDHWLAIAAATDGFVGFAIGRSIWEQPLRDHVAGGSEADFVAAVARNYSHFASVYAAARILPGE